MGQKIKIDDLFKQKKQVKIEDEKGNYADVILQTISHKAKGEALDNATKAKASLQKSLNDSNSDESVLLESSIFGLTKEQCIDEFLIFDIETVIKVEQELLGEDAFKDLKTDSDEFQKELNKRIDVIQSGMRKGFESKKIEDLLTQLKGVRIKRMLNAYYLHTFGETVLFYALVDEDGKQLFESIEVMEASLHGRLFNKLQEAYYNLDSLDSTEVKN